MENSPMLYILCGRSFAGKTTLTKELVDRFGFSVASVDWHIDKYGFDVPKMSQDDWNLVYSQTYERLKNLLQEGKTVILDLGNLKRSERDTARNIAKEVGADYELIYIDESLDEVKKRWKENMESQGRRMDEGTFNKAQEMFEEPTFDEGAVVYNSSIDLDEWIAENINCDD